MKNTITRKMQLDVDYEPKSEEMKNTWHKLYEWQYIVHKAANLISTHNFIQDNIKNFIYLTEEVKVKLADSSKDEEGILNTSKMNSTYRVLSETFKGRIPTNILTALNSTITKTYNKEKRDYFLGNKSLRSYRKDVPIPFQSSNIRDFSWDEERKLYAFTLNGLPFKIWLGRDRSFNKVIIERILSGEYKFCDSSLQIKGGKLFLLMTVSFETVKKELIPKRKINARLGFETPIIASYRKTEYNIGTKEEYLYRRLQIQGGLRRAQVAAKYNSGGRGRKKKIQSIERFKEKEINYVSTKMHQYSSMLIKFALNNKASIINLVNLDSVKEQTSEQEFLLRNWSYHGLIEKIKYKARMHGIEVMEEKQVL
jgi:IS605 OrfB family transposase